MKKRIKLIGIILAALLVVAALGFYIWTRVATYPAFSEAATLAQASETDDGWYVHEPEGEPTVGFVFYPGGLVEPAAYSPLMEQLSGGGVLAVIVPMPLDLAVFGIGRADKVLDAYPEIDRWVIGGHSLGGAMAAQFVSSNPETFDGMVLLASYPADSTDLSEIPAQVLSIYGTEDGVTGDVFEESLNRLPQGTVLQVIEGGNHAQFGNYGPQKGDGTPSVSREDQQQQTTSAILDLVEALK